MKQFIFAKASILAVAICFNALVGFAQFEKQGTLIKNAPLNRPNPTVQTNTNAKDVLIKPQGTLNQAPVVNRPNPTVPTNTNRKDVYSNQMTQTLSNSYYVNMRGSNGKNIKVNINAGSKMAVIKQNREIPKQCVPIETDPGKDETQDMGNSIVTCRVSKNRLDVKSSEWDIISRSTTDNVVPGYVYDLNDIQNTGVFRQINDEREDAFLNINAETVSNPIVNLTAPTVQQILQARQTLLNTQASGTVRAKENTTISEIYDATDFKLHVGFDVFSPTVSVSGLFDFSNRKETIKYLMDYKAELFTIEYAPTIPGKFFKNQDLNGKGNLVYVDKVVYGARIMVAFESELSALDIGGQLDVQYRGPVVVNADLLLKNSTVFKNVNFRIFGWGIGFGESGTVVSASGVEDLKVKLGQMMLRLDNHSKYPSTWGTPVSYSLRNLYGEVVVANARLEELPQRNCTITMKAKNIYKFSIDQISTGRDCDPYGHITVLCYEGNKEIKPLYGMPNGDMAAFQNNNHLSELKLYDRNTDAGICGQTRSFVFNDPGNVKIRIWTWLMDYDGGSGDDPLKIIGGKPMSTINGDFYQDFYLRDLIAVADTKSNGNLCALNPTPITINLQDDGGDSPLIIRIKVCNDYK